MKKFNFKLQSLLRFRHFKEEKLKIELGKVVSKMNKNRDDIKQLNEDIDGAFEAQKKFLSDPIGGKIVHTFHYFINGRREHIKQKKEELEELQVIYDEKSTDLARAMGDVKVIEKIKDKQKTEHTKEYNKKNQADIEDILRMRKAVGE